MVLAFHTVLWPTHKSADQPTEHSVVVVILGFHFCCCCHSYKCCCHIYLSHVLSLNSHFSTHPPSPFGYTSSSCPSPKYFRNSQPLLPAEKMTNCCKFCRIYVVQTCFDVLQVFYTSNMRHSGDFLCYISFRHILSFRIVSHDNKQCHISFFENSERRIAKYLNIIYEYSSDFEIFEV